MEMHLVSALISSMLFLVYKVAEARYWKDNEELSLKLLIRDSLMVGVVVFLTLITVEYAKDTICPWIGLAVNDENVPVFDTPPNF